MSLCLAALWLLCAAEEPQAPRMREQLFASGRPMLAVEEIQGRGPWRGSGRRRRNAAAAVHCCCLCWGRLQPAE